VLEGEELPEPLDVVVSQPGALPLPEAAGDAGL
jgi:hypothetical protein